jgi:hypothetical protein
MHCLALNEILSSQLQYYAGLWIRIRIGSGFSDFVDPDPYWESGSRIRIQGQEN